MTDPAPQQRRTPHRTVVRWVAAGVVAALVLAAAIVMLGAFAPGLPGVGLVGTFVTGQHQVLVAAVAVVGLVGSAVVWRTGWRRAGRALTALAAVVVVAAAAVLGADQRLATGLGAPLSPTEALAQPEQPDVHPDATLTYATVDGHPLAMDVYLPPGPGTGRPAVLWSHGGGFVSGDRTDRRGLARHLADQGRPVFAIEYRMPDPGPTWDEEAPDVACALSWVQTHAATYGVDAAQVTLAGESAGASLSMIVASDTSAGVMRSSCGPAPRPVAAVVALYPVVDLAQEFHRQFLGTDRTGRTLTGGTPEQYPERYAALSPDDHVRPGQPPTLLIVGDHDHIIETSQVEALDAALGRAGDAHRLVEIPFADHVFDQSYGSLGAQISRYVIDGFLAGSG